MKTELLAGRITEIITRLNNGDRLTVKALAEEYGVSLRTIQKDLNERISSCLEVQVEEGVYFLDSRDTGKLTIDDIKSFSALSGISDLYPDITSRLFRLLLEEKRKSAYLILGHNYEDISLKSDEFICLSDAIIERKIINFHYKDKSYRSMKPYRLVNETGIWFLCAVDGERLKSFHLKDVTRLNIRSEHFLFDEAVDKRIESGGSIWLSDKTERAEISIDCQAARYFLRQKLMIDQEIIKENGDGSLLISCRIDDERPFFSRLRYWIPHVRILKPEGLQARLNATLSEYLEST